MSFTSNAFQKVFSLCFYVLCFLSSLDLQYISFILSQLLSQLLCIQFSGDSDIVDIEEDSNPDGHSGKRRDTTSPLSDVGSLSDVGDSDASQSNNGNPLNN